MYCSTVRFLVFSLALMLGAVPVQAFCNLDSLVAAYESALKREQIDDRDGAYRQFMPLAKMGVAPAQRHVAKYYLEESRDDQAIEKAAMWTRLATWGGDQDALKMLRQQSQTVRDDRLEVATQWARDWSPRAPQDCQASSDQSDLIFVGPLPLIKHEAVSEETFLRFANRAREAFFISDQVAQKFYPLINLIGTLEIVPSRFADRFLALDEDSGHFQVSRGFLSDQTPRQLSYSMVLAVQRALFDQLSDAQFNDPLARQVGKIRLIGSIYGDVNTKRYLNLMEGALLKTRNLPSVLYDVVFGLDEVLYMAPSKFHQSRLDRNPRFITYEVDKSTKGKRVAQINHKLGFEDEETLLIHLVRAGTFAQYHSRMEGMKNRTEGPLREKQILKALEGDMTAAAGLFNSSLNQQDQQLKDWQEKGPEGLPKLVCEAVYNQVLSAIHLEMAPTKFTRLVPLKNCAKAKNRWQKYLNS